MVQHNQRPTEEQDFPGRSKCPKTSCSRISPKVFISTDRTNCVRSKFPAPDFRRCLRRRSNRTWAFGSGWSRRLWLCCCCPGPVAAGTLTWASRRLWRSSVGSGPGRARLCRDSAWPMCDGAWLLLTGHTWKEDPVEVKVWVRRSTSEGQGLKSRKQVNLRFNGCFLEPAVFLACDEILFVLSTSDKSCVIMFLSCQFMYCWFPHK